MRHSRFSIDRALWIPFVLGTAMLVSGQGHNVSHGGSPTDGPTAAGAPEEQSIGVDYACGNVFILTNASRQPAAVTYHIAGTDEKGAATLEAASPDNPEYSELQLQTKKRGTLEVFQRGRRVGVRENDGVPCAPSAVTAAPIAAAAERAAESAQLGEWSGVFSWPIVALHLHLLPDGRVLSWGLSGEPQLWNPATGVFSAQPSQDWLFCAGHALLPDGRLFIAGGHISTGHGLPDINLYSVGAGFASAPPMQRGRWYPTTTVMADGSVVITAGRDENFENVTLPELWTSGNLKPKVLTGASQSLPYYPRQFLAPNGKLFYAGEQPTSRYLDLAANDGTGGWTAVSVRKFGNRSYGSAVMYAPGKILYAGGGRTTNTAETIDLNLPSPKWNWTGSMQFARRHLNVTVLPNGEVLATGGVGGTAFNDITKPTRAAELWNPSAGTWRTLASSVRPRGYHATSLLLPDGRVLHTGSGEGDPSPKERNAEIFSPPYLFAGARPTIASAPGTAGYGSNIQVTSPDAASITDVSLIRLGSVTHAFDMNQRYRKLNFTRNGSQLSVVVPDNRNFMPPGHYMLFILNGSGVPSVAKIVRIT